MAATNHSVLSSDETESLSSHFDMHTHAGSTLHNPMTLTFDLLTSVSMRTEVLQESICTPGLVLIAQNVFLLERGHTHTSGRCHWSPYPRIGYTAGVSNEVT